MLVFALLLCFLSNVLSTWSQDGSINLYVATNGNDNWSGKLPSPNSKYTDGPFLSVTRAKMEVRTLKNPNHNATIIVNIRQGLFMERTLNFTSQDSGTNHHSIVYRSYDSQPSVISGGILLHSWRKMGSGPLWMTKIPDGSQFKQMFADGKRLTRARIPDIGYLYWNKTLGPKEEDRGFVYNGNDISAKWRNLDDVNVVVYHAWTASRHYIDHIFSDNRTVIFTNPSQYPFGQYAATAGGRRYYVDNVFEGLDSPGEWYLDKLTNTVYYYPLNNKDPNQQQIVGSKAKFITFSGLAFQHADWRCEPYEMCDHQTTAALMLTYSNNIEFNNSEISHVGEYAIWFNAGTKSCALTNATLYDLGTGGVRIGVARLSKNETSKVKGIDVENSYISDGGYVYPSGCGVLLQQASHCRILHNAIYNFSYTGVSAGWDWSYGDTDTASNLIAFNHIQGDMGGIYTLGQSPFSVIFNNIVHNVKSYNYGSWGLYPDQASSGFLIANNLVYDTKSAGLHQHWGMNNTITNNILAYGGLGDPNGALITDPATNQSNYFSFTVNIVYLTNGSLFEGNWKPSKNPYRAYFFDNNLYWHSPSTRLVFPGNTTLSEWQAEGQDVHSIIADPLFEDATTFNFTLSPNSPAFALGFVPIDTSKVGPQK